jgi:hypothetical protein
MVRRWLEKGCHIIEVVALSLPAATRHCCTWRWLVVASSAQQKQQQHHQHLTNGSTILNMFTFTENLDLFKYLQYILD